MVLKIIWRKTLLYKRFGVDIWGKRILHMLGRTNVGKLFNAWDVQRAEYKRQKRLRYVYRIDLYSSFKGRKRIPRWFLTRRVSRLFYLTLSYSQFRKLAVVASRQEGSWESSFIMLVENRVLGMLYRMQVNMNVFELRWFVLLGNVLVNNKKITYYNAAVKYFDILRVRKLRVSDAVQSSLIERIKADAVYFNTPRYLFVSYKYMFAFVYTEPKRADLVFPNKAIEVYRGADYY